MTESQPFMSQTGGLYTDTSYSALEGFRSMFEDPFQQVRSDQELLSETMSIDPP